MQVNKENFYQSTSAKFVCFGAINDVKDMSMVGLILNEPDFISKTKEEDISSIYWYIEEGVFRASDHWGKVKNCQWDLNLGAWGEYDACHSPEFLIGFCSWEDFKQI
jgi:hypothetical protein